MKPVFYSSCCHFFCFLHVIKEPEASVALTGDVDGVGSGERSCFLVPTPCVTGAPTAATRLCSMCHRLVGCCSHVSVSAGERWSGGQVPPEYIRAIKSREERWVGLSQRWLLFRVIDVRIYPDKNCSGISSQFVLSSTSLCCLCTKHVFDVM